jgi:ribonuclease D
VVQIPQGFSDAPNLKALLANPKVTKIFHFARFDIAVLYNAFGVMPQPIYCTKIASRLARTYTDRHGLKDLVREVLNIDLSKQQQSSDWGSQSLSEAQLAYAASDVLHLHGLRERLDAMLAREGRTELAQACFEFLADARQARSAGLGHRGHFRPFVSGVPGTPHRVRDTAKGAFCRLSVTLVTRGPGCIIRRSRLQ